MSDGLERGQALVGAAKRIVVLTGAGVSAESGIPTFRGERGLWRSYRPEELATPEAFRRDPALVWEWYAWRRSLIAECAPNGAHKALAELALARPGTTIVTQNVDGLHHRAAREAAGNRDPTPAFPLEVHGAIHRDRCSSCGLRSEPLLEGATADTDLKLPMCTVCGGRLRPDVVWFGESLDPEVIGAAFEAAGASDLCLAIGTSAVVHPAAAIPLATRDGGGHLIEVNPEPTPLSPIADVTIRGAAGSVVPELLA